MRPTPEPWGQGLFNAPDQFGNTRLHYAALPGKADVVELYVSMPDIDIVIRREMALDFVSDGRCYMAISARCRGLRQRKTAQQAPTIETRSGRSRKETEDFIKRLGDKYP
jgi:ankyrin repeat protein